MRTAFMSIIMLLIFAGATSLLELESVSHDTQQILLSSEENVTLAREMALALSDQNDAIIYMAIVGDSSSKYRLDAEKSIARLNSSSKIASQLMRESDEYGLADSLTMHTTNLNKLARNYLDGEVHKRIETQGLDSLNSNFNLATWYVNEYKPEHKSLSTNISKYMTSSQSTLGPEVSRLSHTARRAVTPVFISLAAMFVAVIMLFYFLKRLYVKPTMRINRSLGDYLTYKVPFDDTIDCRDEIKELKERIAALISKVNKQ